MPTIKIMKDIPMDSKVLDVISKNYKLTERKVGEEGCYKKILFATESEGIR